MLEAYPATVPGDMSRALLLFLVTLSGATGLVYQSLWLRSFGLVFGTTTDAIALVLAVFMGGLGLGSYLAGRRRSASPLRDYARIEIGIGLTALVTLPLLRWLPGAYVGLASAELLVKALAAAVILLPTTVLLGATVPLVVEFLDRAGSDFKASLGRVYLFNTLGATAGAFLVTFVLVPELGVRATLTAAALVNLCIGGVAWRGSQETKLSPASTVALPGSVRPGLAENLAAVSGLFMFGIEVLWTRSYALVIGSSVYAFSSMLVSVLVGLVLGTAVYDRLRPRIQRPERLLGALFVWTGLAALGGAAAIGMLPEALLDLMKKLPLTFGAHQAASLGLCVATMLPVTTALGFSFPLLAHLVDGRASAQEGSARLYLWNTLGAILGAILTDFLLIDRLALGLQRSFLILAVVPLATGAWILLARSRPILQPVFLAAALAGAAAVLPWWRLWDPIMITSGVYRYGIEWSARPGFRLKDVNSQRELLFYREGKEAVVAVSQLAGKSLRFLSVNGKTDAGSVAEDVLTQKFIAHVPLLLHPEPRRALVIGWGSGATAASAALYPLEKLECVEIEPATYEAAPFFDSLSGHVRRDPRFSIVFRDGRNHLLRSRDQWDVIVSEPSNPWISGVSNLFTREFYQTARKRLAGRGLFGQWFHYYNMEPADVKIELATFAEVFPYVSVWTVPPVAKDGQAMLTADLLLVGSDEPHALDWRRLTWAFEQEVLAQDLKSTRVLGDEIAILASYAFGRPELLRYVDDKALFPRGTPLNTDDQPWIEFRAPRRNVLAPAEVPRLAQELHRQFSEAGADEWPPVTGHPGLAAGGRQSAPLHVALSERWMLAGLHARARRGFERALALDPGNEWALESLGGLAIDGRDWAKAEQLHRGLLVARPDDVDARLRLVAVLARQSKWLEARAALRTARAMDPRAAIDPALVSYIEAQAGS
jgi:spermidine synthase